MSKLRVLVVDDSRMARSLLRAILEDTPDIEVVGEAEDGRQALELASQLRPDLITMDLEMPVMDGLQAIEEIMCTRAVPILVLSSVSDAQRALEATAKGALEVAAKPEACPAAAEQLCERVRLLAGVSVITRLRPSHQPDHSPTVLPGLAPLPPSGSRVFAFAASTGGPQALAHILPGLPADFPAAIVIAQHISDGFAQGMVDWLASLCALPVKLAENGMPLAPGQIYISPSEHNLRVGPTHTLHLQARAETELYHPSCDVLLTSVARNCGAAATGLILSGMGHDGAAGMAAIRAAGGLTLAQDEASSVIYGMNRVAIERGCVQRVLPLVEIAPTLAAIARKETGPDIQAAR